MTQAGRTLEALGLEPAGREGGPIRLGAAPAADLPIASIAVDSRSVEPGALFAALHGGNSHGADFAAEAVKAGAAAILTDLNGAIRIQAALGGWPAPVYVAVNARRRLALVAARFFGAQPEIMAAVTGTNGKTSTAFFTQLIWAAQGLPAASFGTTGVDARNLQGPDYRGPLAHTTPEPVSLHKLLAGLAEMGVTHAAMEASSHGLAQHRLDGVRLSAAAFLNLTRDHLDYHADRAEYGAAKLRLFSELLPEGATAAINADDPLFPSAEAIAEARGLRVIPFGRAAQAEGVRLLAQQAHPTGQTLKIRYGDQNYQVSASLIGAFQGWNALAAAAMAIGTGVAPEAAMAAIEDLKAVRGRMQLAARRANGAGIYVDYAHTPDALITALAALKPHAPGRVHIVFGAGGDRDPGKRPMMGKAAAAFADRVIVTDDNPRSEDPAEIRRAVMRECPKADEIGDRAEAILRGVDGLEPGDALLIAGKGHESGQQVAGVVHPFDDAEQARAAVIALDGEAGELFED